MIEDKKNDHFQNDNDLAKGNDVNPVLINGDKAWIETKKEFEIDDSGKAILKKVTQELDSFRKKDKIDYVLRILPLTAIFIPILIVSLQQKKEFERQKNLFELETYTSTTTNVQIVMNKEINDKEVEKAKDELNFKLIPKIKFINDAQIILNVDSIKNEVNCYFLLGKLLSEIDSIASYLPVSTENVYSFMDKRTAIKNELMALNLVYNETFGIMVFRKTYDSVKNDLNRFLDAPTRLYLEKETYENLKNDVKQLKDLRYFLKAYILRRNLLLDSIMIDKINLSGN